jgi:hypothetical protein
MCFFHLRYNPAIITHLAQIPRAKKAGWHNQPGFILAGIFKERWFIVANGNDKKAADGARACCES